MNKKYPEGNKTAVLNEEENDQLIERNFLIVLANPE